MSKKIPFYKMVASGNDFVVIDNRKKAIKDLKKFTREVCAAHEGAGADGVLLFEKSKKNDFKMRILNLDGSEAEACGNGFRCITLFANKILKFPSKMNFESISGGIEGKVFKTGDIKVQLAKPIIYGMDEELKVGSKKIKYSFLNTGVPHVVVFVKDIEKVDVYGLGKAIREHKKFKPAGTNVNFVQVVNKKRILVRTYERGVENETFACGTGSTASGLASFLKGYVGSSVQVKTRSGEVLKVSFEKKGDEVEKAFLEGKARLVYKGEYYYG